MPLSPAREGRAQGPVSLSVQSPCGNGGTRQEVASPFVVRLPSARTTPRRKRARWICSTPWYSCWMKKDLTISEFARMGGKARAAKLTKEQLSAIGKKGGRPRLRESPRRTGSALNSQAGSKGISLQASLYEQELYSIKKAKRTIKGPPAMDVTEKDDFYRLLDRAIFLPSSPRKSAPKKPAKSGGKKTRQRSVGDVQEKPNDTSR